MNRRQFIAALGLFPFVPRVTVAAEPIAEQKLLTSGPAAGKEGPSFFVRAITGPQMNRSVCFVCRNGDRPVVMHYRQLRGDDQPNHHQPGFLEQGSGQVDPE